MNGFDDSDRPPQRLKRRMITGEQVKAARKLIGWSLLRLANEADADLSTLFNLEREQKQPRPETIGKFQRVLEAAGVEFPEGEQPRLKSMQ
jgi:transcriptional regulator with XRE-family HTH domain